MVQKIHYLVDIYKDDEDLWETPENGNIPTDVWKFVLIINSIFKSIWAKKFILP